ncbi:unnamed protein product [Pleuronectes platessa]|uniref:Uncharacterized protein n=1 Tax=Pleuronectes platessa TaxID=8262 RepID=A0A9N7YKV5_PLEPL|nr:unnamed protein product [Pleuronectes platessa]
MKSSSVEHLGISGTHIPEDLPLVSLGKHRRGEEDVNQEGVGGASVWPVIGAMTPSKLVHLPRWPPSLGEGRTIPSLPRDPSQKVTESLSDKFICSTKPPAPQQQPSCSLCISCNS